MSKKTHSHKPATSQAKKRKSRCAQATGSVLRHTKQLGIYHKILLRNLELQEEINKIAAVLQAHMTALKLEGLRGNQVAYQAFIDVDETWRDLYGCSIEDDERGKSPNRSSS